MDGREGKNGNKYKNMPHSVEEISRVGASEHWMMAEKKENEKKSSRKDINSYAK
jgi:hypothetical protein